MFHVVIDVFAAQETNIGTRFYRTATEPNHSEIQAMLADTRRDFLQGRWCEPVYSGFYLEEEVCI